VRRNTADDAPSDGKNPHHRTPLAAHGLIPVRRPPTESEAMSALQLIHFSEARRLVGFDSTKALKNACQRFNVPIVKLNRRVFALRHSDLELLLDRASGKEIA
jgi:hypothetical protein